MLHSQYIERIHDEFFKKQALMKIILKSISNLQNMLRIGMGLANLWLFLVKISIHNA